MGRYRPGRRIRSTAARFPALARLSVWRREKNESFIGIQWVAWGIEKVKKIDKICNTGKPHCMSLDAQ